MLMKFSHISLFRVTIKLRTRHSCKRLVVLKMESDTCNYYQQHVCVCVCSSLPTKRRTPPLSATWNLIRRRLVVKISPGLSSGKSGAKRMRVGRSFVHATIPALIEINAPFCPLLCWKFIRIWVFVTAVSDRLGLTTINSSSAADEKKKRTSVSTQTMFALLLNRSISCYWKPFHHACLPIVIRIS